MLNEAIIEQVTREAQNGCAEAQDEPVTLQSFFDYAEPVEASSWVFAYLEAGGKRRDFTYEDEVLDAVMACAERIFR